MKIVHYYANDCFDRLISGQQSDNPLREAISILSAKYKRFTFAHPVILALYFLLIGLIAVLFFSVEIPVIVFFL